MTKHRSRRWFQLSLRSLFGLTLLAATFFAGYTMRAKQEAAEREAAREVERQREAEERRALAKVLAADYADFVEGRNIAPRKAP